METNTLGTILLVIMTIIFLSFWFYRLIEDLNKKVTDYNININSLNLGLDQKNGMLRDTILKSLEKDSEHIDKRFTQVYQEIGKIQNVLYRPLYEKGNTVYFYDETSKGVKEFKGKVIEIIQKCGDLPEYKILIGKESRVIHQNLITAWE